MKELGEKHMVVVTALALGLIIFWLIASDPQNAASPSANTAPGNIGAVTSAPSSE